MSPTGSDDPERTPVYEPVCIRKRGPHVHAGLAVGVDLCPVIMYCDAFRTKRYHECPIREDGVKQN
jgi:hypothetical protein